MVRLFFYRCGLCLLGAGGIFYRSAAQPADTVRVHQLQQVEVSAARRPSAVRSAAPLQVAGGAEMERLGYQNLADAVRRFSGVTVKDYGGIGGLKTVSVRSLGAHHTAVMYDGIAVSNCQAGQIDIGRFSLDNVSQVSLAVGQEDDIFQPARIFASAGVLSIRTQQPEFGEDRNYSLQLRAKGGSFGFANPTLRYARKLTSRTCLVVDGDFLRADGTYPFTLKNGQLVTREKRYNSDILSWHTEANLYTTFRDSSTLTAKAYYFQSERGLPGGVVFYNPYNRERLWDRNFFAQAGCEKHFNAQWALKGALKYNYSWNRYMDVNVKYEGGRQVDINRQQEYYGTATVRYLPMKNLALSLAADFAVNGLRNNIPNSPSPVRYTSLSALALKYRCRFLTVTANMLNTFIAEHVKSGARPENRRKLTPFAALSLQPWQERELYIRFLYKSTFRVPAFNDLYYERVGNTGLKPESAEEYGGGIAWSGAPWNFIDLLSVTADVYYNRVSDKIVVFPSTYVWRMINLGKTDITGADVNVRAELPLCRQVGLHFSAGYTWQKAIDVTDRKSKNYKEQIPYTPCHSGSGALQLQTPWINMAYTVIGVGERYILLQNIPANRIDGYAEHTLTLSREFSGKHARLLLQAECMNFTDEQYDIIKYYPMPGRSYRLSATLKF